MKTEMSPITFCIWLRGFLELSDQDGISERQVGKIKTYLEKVYAENTNEPQSVSFNSLIEDTDSEEELETLVDDVMSTEELSEVISEEVSKVLKGESDAS